MVPSRHATPRLYTNGLSTIYYTLLVYTDVCKVYCYMSCSNERGATFIRTLPARPTTDYYVPLRTVTVYWIYCSRLRSNHGSLTFRWRRAGPGLPQNGGKIAQRWCQDGSKMAPAWAKGMLCKVVVLWSMYLKLE